MNIYLQHIYVFNLAHTKKCDMLILHGLMVSQPALAICTFVHIINDAPAVCHQANYK